MFRTFLIFTIGLLFIQSSTDKPIWEIKQKHDSFTCDEFENTYLVDQDKLYKFDSTGTLFKTYNNKQLGNITYVDASNPMRPLIYYQDFFKLLYLDNTLTPNGPVIDLLSLGFSQPKLVCTSSNNSVWVYDQLTQELVRLNSQLEIINRSGNLSQLVSKNVTPHFIVEQNNKVYLADSNIGVMNFDIFGNYLNTLPLKINKEFQVESNRIYYLNKNLLVLYDQFTFSSDTIQPFKEMKARNLWIGKKRLTISTLEGIEVYNR